MYLVFAVSDTYVSKAHVYTCECDLLLVAMLSSVLFHWCGEEDEDGVRHSGGVARRALGYTYTSIHAVFTVGAPSHTSCRQEEGGRPRQNKLREQKKATKREASGPRTRTAEAAPAAQPKNGARARRREQEWRRKKKRQGKKEKTSTSARGGGGEERTRMKRRKRNRTRRGRKAIQRTPYIHKAVQGPLKAPLCSTTSPEALADRGFQFHTAVQSTMASHPRHRPSETLRSFQTHFAAH